MKKLTKRLVKILPVVLMVCFVVTSVFAANTNIGIPNGASGSASSTIKIATGKVWATAITIVQILAVASVVFAGVRYMYSSAEKRADIKRGLSYLAIGAVFVFAAASVARFVVRAGDHII